MAGLFALSAEQLTGPLGIWTSRPRLSSKIDAGAAVDVIQIAYELEIRSDAGTIWPSGRVDTAESALVDAGGVAARSATKYLTTPIGGRHILSTQRLQAPEKGPTGESETLVDQALSWSG